MSVASIPATISSSNPTSKSGRHKYLIFFVPGNPSLVEYYRTFLTHLHALLSSSSFEEFCEIRIFGETLAGFECGSNVPRVSKSESLPFGVEEQIHFAETLLMRNVKRLAAENEDGAEWNVILMGHSFGSFVLLEIIRRFREKLRVENNKTGSKIKIISGICMFPVILNLAGSPRATKLMSISHFMSILLAISFFIRWSTYFLPISLLSFLLNKYAEQPKDAATTTAYFLKGKWGVRQGLHMAQDKLHVIADNKWNHEIWGAANPSPLSQPRSRIFILFGKDDQWVPIQERDDLIKEKGRRFGDNGGGDMWKPVMEIDETGIPHDFCIRHGVAVAEMVAPWVQDVIAADMGGGEM